LRAPGIAIVALAVRSRSLQTRRRRSMLVLAALALAGAGLPILSAVTGIDDHLLARNLLGSGSASRRSPPTVSRACAASRWSPTASSASPP
jgi:hypothetical protein